MKVGAVIFVALSTGVVAAAPPEAPHDGSLATSGAITDVNGGVLDEPGAIDTSVRNCVKSAQGGFPDEQTKALCGCVTDWLRTSKPSVFLAWVKAGTTGDASSLDLRPLAVCKSWAAEGMKRAQPYLLANMWASVDVSQSYQSCLHSYRDRTGLDLLRWCNRLIGTTAKSLKAHPLAP